MVNSSRASATILKGKEENLRHFPPKALKKHFFTHAAVCTVVLDGLTLGCKGWDFGFLKAWIHPDSFSGSDCCHMLSPPNTGSFHLSADALIWKYQICFEQLRKRAFSSSYKSWDWSNNWVWNKWGLKNLHRDNESILPIHKIHLCFYSGKVKSLKYFFEPASKVLTCVGMWNNELRIMRAKFNFSFLQFVYSHTRMCVCLCETERVRGCVLRINATAHLFLWSLQQRDRSQPAQPI